MRPLLSHLHRPSASLAAAALTLLLAACSGGGSDASSLAPDGFGPEPENAAASRFLTRATFGPSSTGVAEFLELGAEAWIDDQLERPPSLMLPKLLALGCAEELPQYGEDCPPPYPTAQRELRDALWWEHATFGPDQLRQRVALALSEVFVVSEKNATLFLLPVMVADYYDTLVEHAFSDYRTLLEEVTLHPAMGIYLSMAKNRKADPETGTHPDENYAREVMQLFSIGLVELEPHGAPVLDADGEPIPTYDQDLIEEVARVLTGWTFASEVAPSSDVESYLGLPPKLGRMEPWTAFHDFGAKQLPAGGFAPAGLTPEEDLDLFLDGLAAHPNVGPFMCRRLIQRLVTSNPTPGQIARAAGVWDDDGEGQRGNLGAVVRAILLDPEAGFGGDPLVELESFDGQPWGDSTAELGLPPAFGKIREPVLRVTALWRAFGAVPPAAATPPAYPGDAELGQKPMSSPSVFNFFSPDYSTPELFSAGLVAPELQISSHSALTATSNFLADMVRVGNLDSGNTAWDLPRIDLGPLIDVADDPAALVEQIDQRLLAGTLTDATRAILVDYLTQIPFASPDYPPGYQRAFEGLALTVLTPEFAIQR